MSVKIITDSTSDIKGSIKDDLDIKVLSLYVSFGGNSIKETEIENKVFYERMEEEGIPTSSQPSIAEIYKGMVEIVSKGHDLLGIFISSGLSGTYNSVCAVREKVMEEYPERKIYILDSRSTSMELGYPVIRAARAAKEGKNIDEIKKLAQDTIERSRFLFIPDNLNHLKKGGRIGGASALIGNILKIIPVLTVRDGKADIFKTVRTKVKAVKTMISQVLKDHKEATIKEIVVHHINNYSEAEKLVEKLEKQLKIKPEIVDIGPIIGLHVGPGAIGVTYYTQDIIRN